MLENFKGQMMVDCEIPAELENLHLEAVKPQTEIE